MLPDVNDNIDNIPVIALLKPTTNLLVEPVLLTTQVVNGFLVNIQGKQVRLCVGSLELNPAISETRIRTRFILLTYIKAFSIYLSISL